MDYTNPDGIKNTVKNHIIALSIELKNFTEYAAPEIIAENAHIIAEMAAFINILNDMDGGDVITVFYNDGLNTFEILDK